MWLKHKDFPRNETTLIMGVKYGCIKNLQWHRMNSFMTISETAFHGNIQVMKWLHRNRLSWDARTFSEEARNGHVDNMKWLFENGRSWEAKNISLCGGSQIPPSCVEMVK
jgi:hypothetical protein